MDLDLSCREAKQRAITLLWEALKICANDQRLRFVDSLSELFAVEIPPFPPDHCAALSWEELRQLAAEDVEIGCHTYTHPILSRISDRSELEREIKGAKDLIEMRLGSTVSHFCYPNGRDIDIGEASPICVRNAGFVSSVTCSYGLNTLEVDPLRIRRVPLASSISPDYAAELLAGLHL